MRELEKKADKYAYEVYSTRPLGDDPTDDEIKEAYIQGYKDAMAWHYPSKGELPTEQNYYFVAVKPSFEGADKFVTLYTYFPTEERWIDKWGYSCREVYAWMPVPEPPKEEVE